MKYTRIVLWVLAAGLVLAALHSVYGAPVAQVEAGALAQKIFYFHVAAAWTAFLALMMAAGFGVAHLISESSDGYTGIHAIRSSAAIEVGFVFCTCVLASGPVWARPVWGVWWRWEPRLTTFLILWAVYASSLVIREAIDRRPVRNRVLSIYAILAALQIPIVYASVMFWKPEAQFHPPRIGLAPEFLKPLWLSLAAWTALLFLLWNLRTGIGRLEEEKE